MRRTTMSRTDGPDEPQEGGAEPGTPRWVKVSWIIAAVIVVVILAALLFGGEHGPGMHTAPRNGPHASSMVVGR
jgi:hypothetical protein